VLNKKHQKIVTVGILLVLSGCMVLFVYMTIFRWIDYAICIPSMTRKISVLSTMQGIERYILETVTPGMTRQQTLNVLENFGRVDIRFQSVTWPPGEVRDTIFIKSCMHPLNNLELYAFYNSEGRLISISLLNDK
jgi:hypothetical protein